MALLKVTEAACWAHAQRKIHDVHARTPSALTEEALKCIGQLYAIETGIRGMPAEQRLAELTCLRQCGSRCTLTDEPGYWKASEKMLQHWLVACAGKSKDEMTIALNAVRGAKIAFMMEGLPVATDAENHHNVIDLAVFRKKGLL